MSRALMVLLLCLWILVACATVETPSGKWNDWCSRTPKPLNCFERWTS